MATGLALRLCRASPRLQLARTVGAIWRGRQVPASVSMAARRFSSTIAEDRRYNQSHEWALLEGKTVTVGISDYAQEKLGEVVYVDLPEVGATFAKGDPFGVVESVKAASDIYVPMSGEVTEVNSDLEDNPELINESCYDKGWIAKLEVTDTNEYDQLLSPEGYEKLLEEETV